MNIGDGDEPRVTVRSPDMSSITPEPFRATSDFAGFETEVDAPPCPECGSIMVRSGACHRCLNCGATSGCS
jgi:ribonucleoside-diphosphate reductase alpha chain